MRLEPFALQESLQPRSAEESLRDLFGVLRRRWVSMLVAFTACLAAGAVYHEIQTPEYKSFSIVLIDPAGNEPWMLEPGSSAHASGAWSNYVDSQVEVLRSREIARSIADKLSLASNELWVKPPGLSQRVIRVLRPLLPEQMAFGKAGPVQTSTSQEAVAVDRLMEYMSVERRGTSFAIEISAISPDSQLSADIANAAVESYRDWRSSVLNQTNQEATEWLNARSNELMADVAQKSEAVEQFRSQARIDTVQASDQLESLQARLAAAQADFAAVQARYWRALDIVRSGRELNDADGVLNSPVLNELRLEYSSLEAQRSQLSSRLGPSHPDMLANEAKVASTQRAIDAEVSRLLASLFNDLDATRSKVEALESQSAELRQSLLRADAHRAQLTELEREAEASWEANQVFQRRLSQVTSSQFANSSRATMLTSASPNSDPVSPRSPLILLASVIAGLSLASLVAIARDKLDRRVRSPRAILEATGMVPMSFTPQLARKQLRLCAPSERHPAGYLLEYPDTRFAESFRLLRTSLLGRARSEGQTVAITSAWSGEGKSTTALCLARAAALSGERVALIDCDLRRRSLNELLNIRPHVGLLQVLSHQMHWRDVMGEDESGIVVLPSAAVPFSPTHLLSSPQMDELLSDLKKHFSLIVVDTPPMLMVSEARAVVSRCDKVVMVARSGKTRRASLAAACHQMHPFEDKMAGVLLNGVKTNSRPAISYYDAIAYEVPA